MKQQGFSDRDGMKGRKKTCGIGKAGELQSFIEEAELKEKTEKGGLTGEGGDWGCDEGCSFLHRGTEAPNP